MSLLETLANTPYACTDLTRISGGYSNFTYRGLLTVPLPDGTSTVVIKHAEPFIASNQAVKFDVIRSYYEQKVLDALGRCSPVHSKDVVIRSPKLYHFFQDANAQIMEDVADSTELKRHLLTGKVSSEEAVAVGAALGSWTRQFHLWGSMPEQEHLRSILSSSKTGPDFKHALNYRRLTATVDKFPAMLGESRGLFEEVSTAMSPEVLGKASGFGIIHGDFWSGNVLLQNTSNPKILASEPNIKMFVIDWEFAQVSSPIFDLGQMLAELYLVAHFRASPVIAPLIGSFLQAYGRNETEDSFRVAIHFGVHLIVWPCRVPGWGDDAQIEDCIRFGLECVRNAHQKQKEWFRGGILEKLFFPASNEDDALLVEFAMKKV